MTPDTPTVCTGCRGAGVVGIPGAPCPFCAINEIAQPATPEPAELVNKFARACAFGSDEQRVALGNEIVARLATQPATHVALTDERAAFEAAMRRDTFDDLARVSDGTYRSYEARVGWIMWQARAALATQVAFSSSNASNTLGDAAARPGLSVADAPTIPIATGEVRGGE